MANKKISLRKQDASLESVVEANTYGVWVDILKHLVRGGRTHRLAPIVAGMFQYAAERASQRSRAAPRDRSVESNWSALWSKKRTALAPVMSRRSLSSSFATQG